MQCWVLAQILACMLLLAYTCESCIAHVGTRLNASHHMQLQPLCTRQAQRATHHWYKLTITLAIPGGFRSKFRPVLAAIVA